VARLNKTPNLGFFCGLLLLRLPLSFGRKGVAGFFCGSHRAFLVSLFRGGVAAGVANRTSYRWSGLWVAGATG